jgi:hypothetical protein
MTQLTQTRLGFPTRMVAAVALAAALVGGIVGAAVKDLDFGSPVGAPTLSARDQVVLQAATEWEARYRQMYPESR